MTQMNAGAYQTLLDRVEAIEGIGDGGRILSSRLTAAARTSTMRQESGLAPATCHGAKVGEQCQPSALLSVSSDEGIDPQPLAGQRELAAV